ncbi:hypothetical protein VTK73DRAFT_1721 [Phialemonium thermophilum]|uniref:Protein FAF1 n=1 Tax=Phialemonium thermophilum TaxID=223376 RepID=A0ABR3X7W5_9PEZI
MPQVLGKRKGKQEYSDRPATPPSDHSTSSESDGDTQAIFRRYFESQFKPIDNPVDTRWQKKPSEQKIELSEDEERTDDTDEGASEWGGISEGDVSVSGDDDNDSVDAGEVEVVDYTSKTSARNSSLPLMSKSEWKSYMSPRPLDPTSEAPAKNSRRASDHNEPNKDEDSVTFLANDLALQRLISESKILSEHAAFVNSRISSSLSSSISTSASPSGATFADGRLRQRTTDLRLRALGSRESLIGPPTKMPMAMRKGIAAAAAAREAKRRREARENGIILERETRKTKKKGSRAHGPAVDLPGVGRMRGAELRLSQRDIRSIEGGGGGGVGGLHSGGSRNRKVRRGKR